MHELNNFPVPLLGFSAYSGTGKTTLLEKLIPILIEQGLNVALVKHSHHDIEMDTPGKDSYRLRKAGACQLLLAGTKRAILFSEYEQQDKKLAQQLQLLNTESLDLVLVEGYRDEAFNKIELHRRELNRPLMFPQDPSIIAIACDQPLQDCTIEQLPLNDVHKIAQFVLAHLTEIGFASVK